MTNRWSVAVIGDINLDYIATLPLADFRLGKNDFVVTTPIHQVLGGTAGNFAKAGANYFLEVHVLGKLGDDAAAHILREYLRSLKVTLHIRTDHVRPSRIVLVLNTLDANKSRHRIMLADEDTANFNVTEVDIAEWAGVLQHIDAIIVDAYSYLREPRRSACSSAMQISLDANAITVFDLVPHDCYKLITIESLYGYLKPAKLVISETKTASKFFGLSRYAWATRSGIINILLPRLIATFGEKSWFLRFGEGNINESLICIPGHEPIHSYTGYATTNERTGFGDYLTARQLRWYLDTIVQSKLSPYEG